MAGRVTIVSRLFRPEPAAAAYRLGALADELLAQGYAVSVLTTRPPDGAAADDAGIDVRRWPVLRNGEGSVRGYLQYLSFDLPLFFRLLCCSTDMVVVEPPPTTGAVSRAVCALKRIPYYHYSADVVSTAAQGIGVNRVVVRVLRAVERWVLRGARQVIAVSDGVRDDLLALGVPEELVTVVGVGVDTGRFEFAPDAATGSARKLVYGGTMSELHGAEVFVRAFARIVDRHPDARMLMVGQGSDVVTLRRLADELAPGRIEFRGPQPPERLRWEFSTAAAALASLKPGCGYDYAFTTKALSGLSAGAPVIYAGVGPMADLIRRNGLGWAVEWHEAAVAEAMDEALNATVTTSRRVELSRWVSRNHSLRSVAANAVKAIG
ncbi:MAG TPA: glycosyltransferase [Pseudonocardia sp.]|jgi:glycosyltransferase involved in cell wall biosynthesis|nr:glycosyltransferase [Pseudonocardia sp.]